MRQRVMIAMALSCEPEGHPLRRADGPRSTSPSRTRSCACSPTCARESGTACCSSPTTCRSSPSSCQTVAVMYAGLDHGAGGRHRHVFRRPQPPTPSGCCARRRTSRDPSGLIPIPGSPPKLSSPPTGLRLSPALFVRERRLPPACELPLLDVGGRLCRPPAGTHERPRRGPARSSRRCSERHLRAGRRQVSCRGRAADPRPRGGVGHVREPRLVAAAAQTAAR